MSQISKKTPDAGKWLLKSPQFKKWRDGHIRKLWCPGNRKDQQTAVDEKQRLMSSQLARGKLSSRTTVPAFDTHSTFKLFVVSVAPAVPSLIPSFSDVSPALFPDFLRIYCFLSCPLVFDISETPLILTLSSIVLFSLFHEPMATNRLLSIGQSLSTTFEPASQATTR